MNSYNDCYALQKVIDILDGWCRRNKMKFHPDKCKALQISYKNLLWLNILPFPKFSYTLNHNILDYTENERDLSVIVNTSHT